MGWTTGLVSRVVNVRVENPGTLAAVVAHEDDVLGNLLHSVVISHTIPVRSRGGRLATGLPVSGLRGSRLLARSSSGIGISILILHSSSACAGLDLGSRGRDRVGCGSRTKVVVLPCHNLAVDGSSYDVTSLVPLSTV